MKLDVYIKNGHVVDTAQGIDEVAGIGIKGRRIAAVFRGNSNEDADAEDIDSEKVIDAGGCWVFPGLIDYHAHLHVSRGISVCPDYFIPTGVTAAVDAGSTGGANYDSFHRATICHSNLRIRSYLSICSAGIVDDNYPEDYSLERVKEDSIRRIFDIYGESILGIKVRLSRNLVSDYKILEKAVKLAEELGTRVCVHPTASALGVSPILDLLRKGDVFAHMYQGNGDTIADEQGRVKQEAVEARKRGVIFDVANGRWNYCHQVAQNAIAAGFKPDIISTDQTLDKINYLPHAKNLPHVMAKFLSMGMTLGEVVKSVTETPAKEMGMEGEIGTLKKGALADVSIFKIVNKNSRHLDFRDEVFESELLLVPQMTILDGDIAFAQMDFNLY